MFTVERRTGRLVEARIFSMGGVGDVDAYRDAFAPIIGRFSPHDLGPGKAPILCADHRPVPIYPPAVADAFVELFTSLNATWERVAILVAPTNATLAMQLQRIVRESAYTSRRVFVEERGANTFLSEVLSVTERARLDAFLVEPAAPPAR